jgi:oleate hydratase
MTEILGHLHAGAATSASVLNHGHCLPCHMPCITSQFLPQQQGDRPQVAAPDTRNLDCMCKISEVPDDVVLIGKCSVRTVQATAVTLLSLKRRPAAVYKGKCDPRVLFHAFKALHDLRAA